MNKSLTFALLLLDYLHAGDKGKPELMARPLGRWHSGCSGTFLLA